MEPPQFPGRFNGYLYLAAKSTLLIAFKSGGTYAYDNVPQSVASGFGNAPSKGKFFQSDIKDRYSTSKLDDTEVANLVSGNAAASASARPPRKKPRVSFESLIQRHPILSAVF